MLYNDHRKSGKGLSYVHLCDFKYFSMIKYIPLFRRATEFKFYEGMELIFFKCIYICNIFAHIDSVMLCYCWSSDLSIYY